MSMKIALAPTISIISGISSFISVLKFIKELIDNGYASFLDIIQSPWFIISFVLITICIIFTYMWLKNKSLEKQIREAMERISRLERANKIPTFKDRYSMVYTHKKDELSKLINNRVRISLMEFTNKICGGDSDQRDSEVKMLLTGTLLEDSYNFRFVITGEFYVSADDIHIKAIDLITNKDLKVNCVDHGCNNEVKEFYVPYGEEMKKKDDTFAIEVSWIWPKMLNLKQDFITLPNFYSNNVDKIRLKFMKNAKQSFDFVSMYKYEITMESPLFLMNKTVEGEHNDWFIFEQTNPDNNTDYIMYYEQK